jgi:2,3-bisphosphoglycerate-dependent phosphoglycerate mutase
MKLYLIRHAQSANNALPEEQRVEDPPLTELGHRQADALAAWMAETPLDILVTSPFRRALETTSYLHRSLRLKPQVWIDLHEQGGCYAGYEPHAYVGRPGMNRAQIQAEFPDYEIEEALAELGWWQCQAYEDDEAARVRARRLLQKSLQHFAKSASTVAFVMHADFKRLFLREVFAAGGRNGQSFLGIYNTAVTQLEFQADRAELHIFNSTQHLDPSLLSL